MKNWDFLAVVSIWFEMELLLWKALSFFRWVPSVNLKLSVPAFTWKLCLESKRFNFLWKIKICSTNIVVKDRKDVVNIPIGLKMYNDTSNKRDVVCCQVDKWPVAGSLLNVYCLFAYPYKGFKCSPIFPFPKEINKYKTI